MMHHVSAITAPLSRSEEVQPQDKPTPNQLWMVSIFNVYKPGDEEIKEG